MYRQKSALVVAVSVSLALLLLPAYLPYHANEQELRNVSGTSAMAGSPGMPGMPGMDGMPGMTAASNSDLSTVKNIASGKWSSATIWQNGRIPSSDDNVTIIRGTTVLYDQPKSPVLGEITVKGELDFTRTTSTSITFGNMTIDRTGYVDIGTIDNPIPSNSRAVIQLASTKEGGAGIKVMGHLEIHGTPIGNTFSKLVKSAENGTDILTVADRLGWNSGDHIVVTSTSLNSSETEENTVASIAANKIRLTEPLQNSHDGTAPAQGEVADLTRNVVVTSYNPAVHAMGVMFMKGSMGGITYAEFSHLGGLGVLGKYPIHFHHVQDSMAGTLIDGVSIWDSHNRFLTIHNSNNITVRNSVGYNSTGHGFFLEDGTEENNTLSNSIAILVQPGSIRPDDGGAAGFWIQNPMNTITGNIAVSASGSGFDLSIPGSAPEVIPLDGKNLNESLAQQTTPTVLTIGVFTGNEAHSNAGDGVHLYRLDQGNSTDYNVFSGMKIWRNGGNGIDITASPSMITSSTIFGNQQGNMQIDTYNMTISNVKVVGELPNIEATLNSINGETGRYMVAPFGLVFNAQNMTIKDSIFAGHAAGGTMGSSDLINHSTGSDQLSLEISNTQLLSKNRIIFGYPINGESYIKVMRSNIDHDYPSDFILYRFDTSHQSPCKVDLSYMAVKCPLGTP